MTTTSKLERQLSTATRERIFQMLRTREVFQYDVTDKVKIAELVAKYTNIPADIIMGYMAANIALAANDMEKAITHFTQDYHGNPIHLGEFIAMLC